MFLAFLISRFRFDIFWLSFKRVWRENICSEPFGKYFLISCWPRLRVHRLPFCFPAFCSCLVAFDRSGIFWLHSCLCAIYAAAPAIIINLSHHRQKVQQSGNRTSQSWRRRWFSCLLAIVFAPGAKKLNAKLHSLIRIRSLWTVQNICILFTNMMNYLIAVVCLAAIFHPKSETKSD